MEHDIGGGGGEAAGAPCAPVRPVDVRAPDSAKNPAAVALGRLGAKARNAKLTAGQRQAIARKGGETYWKRWRAARGLPPRGVPPARRQTLASAPTR
jgi:hypothetical protein